MGYFEYAFYAAQLLLLYSILFVPIPQPGEYGVGVFASILGVVTVSNAYQILSVIRAASDFVAHTRIWIQFLYALNLLIATFAVQYWAVSHAIPASLTNSNGTALTRIQALYLSITTMTTATYGDISTGNLLARTMEISQELLSFGVLISLGYVLLRTVDSVRPQQQTYRIKAMKSELRGYASLHLMDRPIAITTNIMYVWLLFGNHEPSLTPLAWWKWTLLVLGLFISIYLAMRTLQAAVDPVDASDRVKYLFIETIAAIIYGYTYTYWYVSHALGTFAGGPSGNSLTRLDAFYFTLTTLTGSGFGRIMPIKDEARVLICMEQVTLLFLFGVILVFANTRWKPATEVVSARFDKESGAFRKKRTPGSY